MITDIMEQLKNSTAQSEEEEGKRVGKTVFTSESQRTSRDPGGQNRGGAGAPVYAHFNFLHHSHHDLTSSSLASSTRPTQFFYLLPTVLWQRIYLRKQGNKGFSFHSSWNRMSYKASAQGTKWTSRHKSQGGEFPGSLSCSVK